MAGLRRDELTHKHTGLKDLFYAIVRTPSSVPRVTTEVLAEADELNRRIRTLTDERDRWQTDAQ